jgi:hypothetical protein
VYQHIYRIKLNSRHGKSKLIVDVGELGVGIIFKPLLKALVGPWRIHPGGSEMYFNAHPFDDFDVAMVIDYLVHLEFGTQEINHFMPVALYPDINITSLPQKGFRVKSRSGLPLQYATAEAAASKAVAQF